MRTLFVFAAGKEVGRQKQKVFSGRGGRAEWGVRVFPTSGKVPPEKFQWLEKSGFDLLRDEGFQDCKRVVLL